MNTRSCFLIALLSAIWFFGNIFADISVTSTTLVPDPLLAGANGVLIVTVTNTGSILSTVVIDTASIRPIIADNRIPIGDLEAGGSATVSIPIRVESNAETGLYTLRMTIYGSSKSTSATSASGQLKTITVPVKVLNKPLISLESKRISIEKETEKTFSVKLLNKGGKAINTKIALASDYFVLVNGNPLAVDELVNSTEINITVYAKSTLSAGSGVIPLMVTYQDLLGNQYSESVSIPVDITEKKSSFTVSTLVSEVRMGSQSEIKFLIRNTGDEAANNVRVQVQESGDFTPIGSSEVLVGSLKINEEKEFRVPIAVAQGTEGFKTLRLNVIYEDRNGNRKSESYAVGLRVIGNMELLVYTDVKPVPMVAGKEHTFAVIVSNAGSSKIRGLEVELKTDDSLIVLDSSANQFIGSLEEDDFSSVQYRIIPKQGTRNANVNVLLRYQDVFNNNVVESKNFTLRVYSKEESASFNGERTNNLILFASVGFVAVLILLWYFKFRKKAGNR